MTRPSIGDLGTERESVLPRVVAAVVDSVIGSVWAAVLGVLFVASLDVAVVEPGGEPGSGLVALTVAAVVGAYVGYFALLEWRFGRTIGKWFFGIVVVRHDGARISLAQSIVRNVLRLVDSFGYYLVGMASIAATERGQRIGDLVAGTVVVKAAKPDRT